MYDLPVEITIQDRHYQITNNGDYRVILDCFKALSDNEMSEDEQVLASLLIFYNEFTDIDEIPRDEETLKRELGSLQKIKDHYPKMILTLDEDPQADYEGIRRINALEWLLDFQV